MRCAVPPLLNASLTDCVFEVERETSAEEVENALFKGGAAEGPLKGILGYEGAPAGIGGITPTIHAGDRGCTLDHGW